MLKNASIEELFSLFERIKNHYNNEIRINGKVFQRLNRITTLDVHLINAIERAKQLNEVLI